MKRVLTAGLVSAALVAVAVGVPQSAAQAASPDVTVKSITVSPAAPVLRPNRTTPVRVNVVFNATPTQEISTSGSWLVVQGGPSDIWQTEDFDRRIASTATTQTWQSDFSLTSTAYGRAFIGVRWTWFEDPIYETVCEDIDGEQFCTEEPVDDGGSGFRSRDNIKAFSIRTTTSPTLSAPASVTKGKKFTVKGSVREALGDGSDWGLWSYAKVKIYFDPKGKGGAKLMGTAKADYFGAYSKKFTAKKTGAWTARVSADAGHFASVSKKDTVKVKPKKR